MTTVEMFVMLLAAVAGALVAAALSLVPALHVYTVTGFILLAGGPPDRLLPAASMAMFLLGMATGYAMLNTIPTVFFCAPDDSSVFVIQPAQEYLRQRRGYEAVVLSAIGGLGGVAVLVCLTPLAPVVLPAVHAILLPHLHWILWAVTAFMLLSEWPKGSGRRPVGIARWWDAWKNLLAGLLAFSLSGLLGFILIYHSPVSARVASLNLLPAFAGLFSVPWLVQNILSRAALPEQHLAGTVDVGPWLWLRGIFAGSLGGLFAAFFPVVTGGIGGLIAGHATAQRDDRLFIISQGACRVTYYAGSLLLYFVPGLFVTRGGMAWMLSGFWAPHSPQMVYLAAGGVVLAGVVSFFLLLWMARVVAGLVTRVPYRWTSLGTLVVTLAIVVAATGWRGLLTCVVASGIGLIPVLWGARRMNCMGVLLLPIGLNMAGVGGRVAAWLGLAGL